jgi:hypothetical protein
MASSTGRSIGMIGLPYVTTLLAGMGMAWVGTRPHWDDTGVTAAALVLVSAVSALVGVRPWIAAGLSVGPLLAAELRSGNVGLLLAAVFALAGAYGASTFRHLALRRGQ